MSVKTPSAMKTPPISARPTTCRTPGPMRHQCPARPYSGPPMTEARSQIAIPADETGMPTR